MSTILLSSCFWSPESIGIAGAVITTNTSPSAKIYIFEPGNVVPIDSAVIQNGHFKATPPGRGPWTLWWSPDSVTGAWASRVEGQNIQLVAQKLGYVHVPDSMAGDSVIVPLGYGGKGKRSFGSWRIPVLPGSGQLWQFAKQDYTVDIASNVMADTVDALFRSEQDVDTLPAYFGQSTQVKQSLQFVDPRDLQAYNLVQIGAKVWMAQNLRYQPPGVLAPCPNDMAKCAVYGRMYNWHTARTVCPTGFHLPDSLEMSGLIAFAETVSPGSPGLALKNPLDWANSIGRATNSTGFDASPTGYGYPNGAPSNFGIDLYQWVDQMVDVGNQARILYMNDSNEYAFIASLDTTYYMTIRCVQN